jgi:type II secretion system protein N
VSKIISPIVSLFKYHKLKILGVAAFALLFALLIFPYDDLADLATAKVSQITNNQVYLQFDTLDLALLPPGVAMGGVSVETTSLPALKAESITISPWLSGLLMGKQGGSVDAKNLFGGVIAADLHDGEKAKGGERVKNIAIEAQGLKLPALSKFLTEANLAQFLLQGTLGMNTQLTVDPLFDAQPHGDVSLKVDGFTLPGQTLRVAMVPGAAPMPLPIPEVKLGNTKLTAKMADGSLKIEDFSFGSDQTLAGKITGQIGVTFRRSNAGVQPVVGTYDLRVNLRLPKAFVTANEKAGLSLAFALLPQAARKDTAKGTELAFRVQPPAPGQGVPQITAIQ